MSNPQAPSISSDLLWVMEIMTKSKRFRIYLYTSMSDFEEGMATATDIVDGELALGALILKWMDKYSRDLDAFILDMVRDPRF